MIKGQKKQSLDGIERTKKNKSQGKWKEEKKLKNGIEITNQL